MNGIYHCDIKLSNIMFEKINKKYHYYLIDFSEANI